MQYIYSLSYVYDPILNRTHGQSENTVNNKKHNHTPKENAE